MHAAPFESILKPIWVSVTAVKPKPRCPKPQCGWIGDPRPSLLHLLHLLCSHSAFWGPELSLSSKHRSGVLCCPQICFPRLTLHSLPPSFLPPLLSSPWEGLDARKHGSGLVGSGARKQKGSSLLEAKVSLGTGRKDWPVGGPLT